MLIRAFWRRNFAFSQCQVDVLLLVMTPATALEFLLGQKRRRLVSTCWRWHFRSKENVESFAVLQTSNSEQLSLRYGNRS